MAASPPEPKRIKMSSDDDESASVTADAVPSEPRRRYKRRKIAIFLAYCGAGYQGMQKNPGARTIEGDLEEAFFLAGAVPDPDRGCPKRYDWARSARTDKGVSAAGQVVSGRFYVDPPGLVDRLNSALSPQIRVFGVKRATASFNAKKFCDRRRYVYLLPVFALDPTAHPDRESVIASLGSGSDLSRCLECSERGRKVPGLMGRQSSSSVEEEERSEHSNSNPSSKLDTRVSNIEGKTGVGNDKCDAISNPDFVEGFMVSQEKVETKIANVESRGGAGCRIEGQQDNGASNSNPSSKLEIRVSNIEGETGVPDDQRRPELAGSGGCGIDGQVDNGASNSNPSSKLETRVSNIEGKTKVGNDKCDAISNPDFIEGSMISLEKVETKIESVESQPGENMILKDKGLNELLSEEVLVEEKSTVGTSVLKEEEKMGSRVLDFASGEQMAGRTSEFRYRDKEKERFNAILKRFVGTHNFHNLTTRTKAEDPSAQRYIISFTANSIVSIDGIEFVKCEVVGQSFMLHQIRKMIGLAVAVMRNCTSESLMDTALRKDVNINVPTAPEVGLYLDECFFTSYNQKWKDSHEELSMESYTGQAEEFKMKHIYTHIASMEHKEGAVALWLHSLNHRNYPDFHYLESNGECVNAENTQADIMAD